MTVMKGLLFSKGHKFEQDNGFPPGSSEPGPSSGDTSRRWGTARLRLLFLVPLALAIAIIVLVLSINLYQQANSEVQEGIIRIRASVQNFYDESVQYDAQALQAIMQTLRNDKKLAAALAQRNRLALLQHAKPLYEDLRRDFNITHFYFTGTDRVNLLRVHAPFRYGDVIERITMLQAESSGSIAYGVELGSLGTFTLRVVAPWYDKQTHKLIGYVELGMETDQVIKKLEDFFGVQVITVINKEVLQRDKWENGMRTLGRTPRWDRFPEIVTSEQSMHSIPALLTEHLEHEGGLSNNNILQLMYQDRSYQVTTIPLHDMSGRNIARMILVADVSEEETIARQTIYTGSITALTMGGALFLFFYWLVGRIGQRIESNEKELQDLASHDGLTGLFNHRSFYSLLEDEIARAGRYKHPASLLLIDIDHFKRVNDSYGHQAGDEILRALSERLLSSMRCTDKICRYGGEEITIILPEADKPSANKIAENVRTMIAQKPFAIDNGQNIKITVSIGLATYPQHAEDLVLLVSAADTALYEAKGNGRNRVCVYDPHN
jgi:diguanylate cyclase (GGDEF)-like protein